MARTYAQIKLAIWQDNDFRALSPDAQHLYFVLLTNPTLNQAGVADWRPSRIAALASGWTVKRVRAAADELVSANYISIDEETEEVCIRTFVRHDGVLRNPKTARGMLTSLRQVYSTRIRDVIVRECERMSADCSDAVLTILDDLPDTQSDTQSNTQSHYQPDHLPEWVSDDLPDWVPDSPTTNN